MNDCNYCEIKNAEIKRLHTVCKNIRVNALSKIYEFSKTADLKLFKEIFKESAPHLWQKYSIHFKHDLMSFYRSLDTDNQNHLNHFMNEIL
ncbi:MAG: hypothetical protein A2309_09370 [Bacteroidetes bacterium RIFOXYB2_FULL_35_7]|nr:MAG: hypothetical protein A2X01_14860 [Bacteroidetes bacterium GWF2_35_48]OFY92890.1 MAG: hypothetical protein A2309_09370 [Bacteroidetes bacterium RIFOXYB2_FULL_35_7]OFY97173.1 MAG: hypothetical protein A2491_21405 [Bacteroidetes bacterium RIFOXYC12_FULL_35_7]HBX50128.1 hypothetical protein [Bacteroidales bacterium]